MLQMNQMKKKKLGYRKGKKMRGEGHVMNEMKERKRCRERKKKKAGKGE